MSPNNGNDKNPNGLYVPTNGGKNTPKQIHVAHRRSQSELTNLMIEQFTLQRQLEMVHVQQQQLLVHQQQLAQQASQYMNSGSNKNMNGSTFVPYMPPPYYNSPNKLGSPKYGNNNNNRRGSSHSRNNSGYYNNNNANNYNSIPMINVQDSDGNKQTSKGHKNTDSQSGVYGHSRRQSLVLDEAKKAAAEEQAKRSSNEKTEKSTSNAIDPPPSFKFPANGKETSHGLSPKKKDSNKIVIDSKKDDSFTFPHPPTVKTNLKENDESDFIKTPTSHRRSKSRTSESNWRSHGQSSSIQLSPFRHRQSASKDYNSFSALEPPAVFQPNHHNRPSGSSIQSFNSHTGNSGPNQRKTLFAPYLPQANIPELIQEGRLIAGVLRVNKKNRSDAWVSTDGVLDADIYICGSKDRNRALEGDLVAVELLVVDDVWESKKEKEEKKRRKDATIQHDIIPSDTSDDYHNDASTNHSNLNSDESVLYSPVTPRVSSNSENPSSATSDNDSLSPSRSLIKRRGSLKQRPTQKKNDDVEVEGQSLLLVEEEEINDDFKPLYAGHVVAVLDRIPGQLFSGTLGLLRPSQKGQNDSNKVVNAPKIVWFKPTDKKVPLIAIPTELAPKDFVENTDKYADKLFVAALKRWPITSLHPFGIIVSELGDIHDPETETSSILRDKNFLSNEYIDPKDPKQERSSFQALPLSEESKGKRKYFTKEGEYEVIAIINHALLSEFAFHLKDNDDGTLEFGCHVVDVTEHIEEGSSLDRRARKRSSSVFMPQKVVHLLPEALNKSLTLSIEKKSATLSTVFTIDANTFEVKSTWIGESIIFPSSSITNEEMDYQFNVSSSNCFSKIKEIARSFYSERIKNPEAELLPALSLFEYLDDEKVKTDLNIFDRSLASVVIIEIQRFVNKTIANEIFSKLGEKAFLRRQVSPNTSKMESFKKKVQKLGYDIDVTSSSSLINSILKIKNGDVRTGVEILLFKSMPRAKYFVAGIVEQSQYGHYASNLALYTHFSSPLRRYADHVVHRQLKSVLRNSNYEEDLESLKITSEYCNFKKDCAYEAQEQVIHLLLCNTINDMGNATGQLLTMATVIQVYESSFDVFIPEFGIEKRVHGDQLPLIKAEFDSVNKILELYWQPKIDSATFIPNDERNPTSFRNSIKNKFRATSEDIANMEFEKVKNGTSLLSETLAAKLDAMHLSVPKIRLPESSSDSNALNSFIETTITKKQNDNYIQEIHELQQVPVLLRAEIGMALPCLTVCALNPFLKSD